MKKRNGFTLVELLVVISIIALLLSILMPSLTKARKNARRVMCASNLHSAGVAMNMYAASDDRERLPARKKDYELRYLIYDPYYKIFEKTVEGASKVFWCPEFRHYPRRYNVTWCPEPERNRIYHMEPFPNRWDYGEGMSLGYSYLGGKDQSDQSKWRWNLWAGEKWKSPLTTCEKGSLPLMADYIMRNSICIEASHRRGGSGRVYYWESEWPIVRMGIKAFDVEGGNVLLLDGSVSWRKLEKLKMYPSYSFYASPMYHYW